MYYPKQSFFVLGLSRSGKAAAEYLLRKGATVYLYDDRDGERVEQVAAELAEKGGRRVKRRSLPAAWSFATR